MKRPEWRWAAWSAAAGALAAAAVAVKGILSSTNSTAAIGFIFVPFVMAAAAVPGGAWGAALGYLLHHARGRQRGRGWLLAACAAAVAALPAYLAYQVARGLALEAAVHEALAMDARQLDAAFETSAWRRDRFYLGAIAQNPQAGAALLDRIAGLDDPGLFEPLGSMWEVKGANRKGIEVMRLVARHPHTSGGTLAKLASLPRADRLLYELLSNPRTPMNVLARWFDSADYLAEWGLALNPVTPAAVMERLSHSANTYTRMNLTYNSATPAGILERLAGDADEIVARNAARALKRKGGAG